MLVKCKCGQAYDVKDSHRGETVKCQKCGADIILPEIKDGYNIIPNLPKVDVHKKVMIPKAIPLPSKKESENISACSQINLTDTVKLALPPPDAEINITNSQTVSTVDHLDDFAKFHPFTHYTIGSIILAGLLIFAYYFQGNVLGVFIGILGLCFAIYVLFTFVNALDKIATAIIEASECLKRLKAIKISSQTSAMNRFIEQTHNKKN